MNTSYLGALDSSHQHLIIMPTEACDFRCVYCYEDFSVGQMKEGVLLALERFLASRIPELRSLSISWFGGEPLLATPILVRLGRFADTLCRGGGVQFRGSISTNGYRLDRDTLANLVSAEVRDFQIYLDGKGAAHDATRHRANGEGTMLRFDDISPLQRSNVVSEAAPLLLEILGDVVGGPGAPMRLGTSIAEDLITPEWIAAEKDDDAAAKLRATGQTFSLLEVPFSHPTRGGAADGRSSPIGYVRHTTGSGDSKDAVTRITAVSGSDLSARVREALDWIGATVPGDPFVRILTAPAYQMTALGIYSNTRLTQVVVVTPPLGQSPVVVRHLYDAAEFRRLMRGYAPTLGITG